MSYRIQPAVWRAHLDATAKLVLLRLTDHADDQGGKIYPSVPSVATACGLRDRAVQSAIRRLRVIGVLVEVRPADFSERRPTEYKLDLSRLQALDDEASRCTKDTGVLNAPVHLMREPVSLTTSAGVLNAPKSSIEPTNESPSSGADAPVGRYAWQGKVVRVNVKDYQAWKSLYHAIPDFDADLAGLDGWWDGLHPEGDPKRRDWYHAVPRALANSHQKWTAEIKNPTRRLGAGASGGDVAAETDALYRSWGVQ